MDDPTTGDPYKWCDCLYVQNIKKCMRISKWYYHSKLLQVMSQCVLKIKVNLLQLFFAEYSLQWTIQGGSRAKEGYLFKIYIYMLSKEYKIVTFAVDNDT